MFLIPPPRATSSPAPSPGQLAMIVTEYMENGSLDTFLRVRAPPLLSPGPGEGSSVWVVGDNVRPPDTPSSPELGPNRPGEGEPGVGRGLKGQPIKLPFSPPSRGSPSAARVLLPCPAHRLRGVPLWGPRAPVSWEAWRVVVEIPRCPALAVPFICWVLLGTGRNLSGPPFLLLQSG